MTRYREIGARAEHAHPRHRASASKSAGMSLNSATETVSVSAPWSSAGSIGNGYRLAVSGHSSQLTVSGTQNVVTETSFGWLLAVSATVHRTLLLLLTLLSTTDSLLVSCLRGLWMESGALFSPPLIERIEKCDRDLA